MGNGNAFVVSGSEDGSIVLWDVKSKDVVQRLEGHAGVVLGVDTHPDLDVMVSCGLDQTIRIWQDVSAEGSEDTQVQRDGKEMPGDEMDVDIPKEDETYEC